MLRIRWIQGLSAEVLSVVGVRVFVNWGGSSLCTSEVVHELRFVPEADGFGAFAIGHAPGQRQRPPVALFARQSRRGSAPGRFAPAAAAAAVAGVVRVPELSVLVVAPPHPVPVLVEEAVLEDPRRLRQSTGEGGRLVATVEFVGSRVQSRLKRGRRRRQLRLRLMMMMAVHPLMMMIIQKIRRSIQETLSVYEQRTTKTQIYN